ncbi:immunity protein 7 of polymorphic toxin system [Kribbella amoyensis]|uniref:Immunity protein 7 of polymorphic toxin system n=1 Tax=Kribbella amoyensis TaxID=996641 RepID=A0A561BMC3_9ACTN|nr:Imm7 family immunity protein [Kribbella amoyensis]TWD79999.1 immunity protein 7 of polymorphic toxin system [Kribbella amoyensis]
MYEWHGWATVVADPGIAYGGPVELFRSIAELAPGSYGVLYAIDFDRESDWRRWVLRRGTVSAEVDASLSPHVGRVEDPAVPE